MLRTLRLGVLGQLKASQLVPPIVQPLIAAARHGHDIAPVALAIVKSFGFDGFSYAVSLAFRPRQETRSFVYNTWPEALTRTYDERAFIEIDPRISDILASVTPLVWDQTLYRGRSTKIDEFLDVMQSFGIASGVVCGLRDHGAALAILSLSSAEPVFDEARRRTITRHMGDMLIFQRYFHELFVKGVLNDLVPPFLEGEKLSARELECLTMAARGLTGEDIALKLSISPRTVQSHFDSIRSKLRAANRQEAIFRAMQLRIISE